MAINYTPVHSR